MLHDDVPDHRSSRPSIPSSPPDSIPFVLVRVEIPGRESTRSKEFVSKDRRDDPEEDFIGENRENRYRFHFRVFPMFFLRSQLALRLLACASFSSSFLADVITIGDVRLSSHGASIQTIDRLTDNALSTTGNFIRRFVESDIERTKRFCFPRERERERGAGASSKQKITSGKREDEGFMTKKTFRGRCRDTVPSRSMSRIALSYRWRVRSMIRRWARWKRKKRSLSR